MQGISAMFIGLAIGCAATGDLYYSSKFFALSGLFMMWHKHRNSWDYTKTKILK